MRRLRLNVVLDDPTLRVAAVASVEYQASRTGRSCRIYAAMEPVAVVVTTADGTVAFDMQAEPVDVGRLEREIPGLRGFLHTASAARGDHE